MVCLKLVFRYRVENMNNSDKDGTNFDPVVGIIMGSQSDWPTMRNAALILEEFKIPHEIKVISAHRTPKRMNDFSNKAEKRGIKGYYCWSGGSGTFTRNDLQHKHQYQY